VRLKQLLNHIKISAAVMQTPGRIQNGGCNFSLKIQDRSLSNAEKAARNAGIRILSVSGSDSG